MLAVSVICFAVRELLSASPLYRQISFISGICIFLVAISPLFSALDKIRDIELDFELEAEEEKYEDIFEAYIKDAETELIRAEIRRIVTEKFSLDPSEVKVYLKYDGDTDKGLLRVTVNLSGRAAFSDTDKIKSYLEGVLDCEIVMTVGEIYE